MQPRRRQPDAPVPSRRRLLADVDLAGRHAAPFIVADGAVRHLAPASDQARRQGHRAETRNPYASAACHAGSSHLLLRAHSQNALPMPTVMHNPG